MVYSNIPTEWQQSLGSLEKNSKLELQNAAREIDSDIIRIVEPKRIVTYEQVVQKNRTLNPGPLIKQQVNKNREVYIDKTEVPVQMIVKKMDRIIDMSTKPGFAIGTQHIQSHNREFNYITPKNSITNSHRDKKVPNIINQLSVVTKVEPRKVLAKKNLYDTDREITNNTPIHPINQDIIRVYNRP